MFNVAFIETSTMKGINAVAVQTKETVKVKVNAPFRIVHQGVPCEGLLSVRHSTIPPRRQAFSDTRLSRR
jgi:hypothetical protein